MVGSIGSLYGKTIRLTYQLYHDTQGTHLKGFVDLLDGQGPRQFVDLLNPQASGLPLVDHAAISVNKGDGSPNVRFMDTTITPLMPMGGGTQQQPPQQQGPMNTARTSKMKMPRNS